MNILPRPESLVGATAAELVERVFATQTSVERFHLLSYIPHPGIDERLGKKTQASLGDATRVDRSVATELLRHDDAEPTRQHTVTRAELASIVADPARYLPDDAHVLAICSNCELSDSGGAHHVLMMDFRIVPSPSATDDVTSLAKKMGVTHGAVLESGRSYHLYGYEPVDELAWLRFMGRCILANPLTDTRYIGHRLIAGYAVLRITSCERKPHVPRVVASW
jgi:hypothetical protein